MPLKTVFQDEVKNAAALTNEEWYELRQRHAEAQKRGKNLGECFYCHQAMHPAEKEGTRFFKHNPHTSQQCVLHLNGGESNLHRQLKIQTFRAMSEDADFICDVEAPLDTPDPITGKPVIVDVIAKAKRDATKKFGMEIQISQQDDGLILARNAMRQKELVCTWITTERPHWSTLVPWYRVIRPEQSQNWQVIDGVVDFATGERVGPFPANRMAHLVLQGIVWAQDEGFRLVTNDGGGSKRPNQYIAPKARKENRVQDYCERVDPAVRLSQANDRGYLGQDWEGLARMARARRDAELPCDDLDIEALRRHPD